MTAQHLVKEFCTCPNCMPRLGPQPYDNEAQMKVVDRILQHLKENQMSQATLRCKVRVSEVSHMKDADGKTEQERVKLSAVYSNDPKSENHQWSKWTPSANFELYINNPDAIGKLSKGHEYFIDFIPVSATSE